MNQCRFRVDKWEYVTVGKLETPIHIIVNICGVPPATACFGVLTMIYNNSLESISDKFSEVIHPARLLLRQLERIKIAGLNTVRKTTTKDNSLEKYLKSRVVRRDIYVL